MMKQSILLASAAMLVLAGCSQDPYGRPGVGGMGTKESVGTLGGAAAGAILGSNVGGGKGRIAAIAIGTLLGAGLGNSIGSSLDRADIQYYNQTSQQALETGQPGQAFPWQNPQSGHGGTVVPQGYYQTAGGQYCREYTQTIQVDGRSQQAHGRACREPDGTWKVVQ